MITGDSRFHETARAALQRSAVEHLETVYWGPGARWPRVPEGQFDVVTAQDPFWRGLFGWRLARRLGARLNVQVHADLSAQPLWKRLLAGMVLRSADSIRVVSHRVQTQVEALGVRAPIHVLPVFVEVSRLRSLVRAPEPNLILWIGRFEEEKSPRLALSVLRAVREIGVPARMVMLGAGSLYGALEAAAMGLPVEFPGWVDPIPYLARASVMLSTSRHESWGASMVEALAAGVPVVAPPVGIAEEAGAIVVPREKLAETVAEALRQPPHAELSLPVVSAEEWVQQWKDTL